MIKAKEIDTEKRKIAGRPYVVKFAYEIEVGEAIWTQTENGYELWHITGREDNTQPVDPNPIYPSGITGMIGFVCKEGTIMHDANGGVYLDIKKGR